MTIPDLITRVLESIRTRFYADRLREFLRDERALTKAIARYGYECDQRGWQFNEPEILAALMNLLIEIKKSGAQFRYLPTYLEGAVGLHLRTKAEEYSARAKAIPPKVAKLVRNVRSVEAVRERSATETLGMLYRDLKKRKPASVRAGKQKELFG